MPPSTTLIVLGSGSKGNAFALIHENALLLIDAGFSVREMDRRLADAGIDPGTLVGVAVTHEHSDHAAGATRLAQRHHVPLLSSLGTWGSLAGSGEHCEFQAIGSRSTVTLGPFTVNGCPTSHDAAEPLALGITVSDGCSVGVAYDLGRPTQAVRYFLRERHCLVIEANHDEVMLRTSKYPPVVQQRIAGVGGHLSNLDAARLLEEVHHEGLGTVVLAHLSQRCNRPEVARGAVEPVLLRCGFSGRLVCAEQEGPMAAVTLARLGQQSLF